MAQRIIDTRADTGPFQYPEDLLSVSGIGPQTLSAIRSALDAEPAEAREQLSPQHLLNIGDIAALDALPGIGPSLAQAIIDTRAQRGPFTTLDDLLHVPGIGEKRLEAIRETLEPQTINEEVSP